MSNDKMRAGFEEYMRVQWPHETPVWSAENGEYENNSHQHQWEAFRAGFARIQQTGSQPVGEAAACSDPNHTIAMFDADEVPIGTKLYISPEPWTDLAASLYQACGAYDMPERILDVLSLAQRGEPFGHLVDGLLPCAPQPDSEPVAVIDDDSPVKAIGEIGNQIHNLGCDHQNDEELSDRLAEIAHSAWMLQRNLMTSSKADSDPVGYLYRFKNAVQLNFLPDLDCAEDAESVEPVVLASSVPQPTPQVPDGWSIKIEDYGVMARTIEIEHRDLGHTSFRTGIDYSPAGKPSVFLKKLAFDLLTATPSIAEERGAPAETEVNYSLELVRLLEAGDLKDCTDNDGYAYQSEWLDEAVHRVNRCIQEAAHLQCSAPPAGGKQ